MHKEKKATLPQILLLLFFVICIALPFVLVNTKDGAISTAENRVLAYRPELYTQAGTINTEYMKQFDEWIDDNIGFRDGFVKMNTWLQFHLFQRAAGSYFKVGENDELFYVTDETIRNFQGFNLVTGEQLQTMCAVWSDLKSELNQQGIQLMFTWIPNKETVYGPGHFLAGVNRISQQNRYDQIENLFSQSNCVDSFVSMRQRLLEAYQQGESVFWRYFDASHWNTYGSHLGFQEMMQGLHTLDPRIPIPLESEFEEHLGEFPLKINGVPLKTESASYYTQNGNDIVQLQEKFPFLEYKETSWYYKNTSKPALPKLIIAGDSYIYSFMLQDFTKYFSEICFISEMDIQFLNRLIETIHPDYVLVEKVERMVDSISRWNARIQLAADMMDAKSLDTLPENGFAPTYSVDAFNSVPWSQRNIETLAAGERNAVISGWAVDPQGNGPASQVVCKVNGNYYASEMNINRPDVAAAFGNDNYLKCGFILTIPAADYLLAEHIQISIVSNDGTTKFNTIELNTAP